MNAPDSSSTPEPRPLSERASGMLRQAIVSSYRRETDSDGRLGDALRHAAAEARERGLRPEELVIAIKSLLDDIPNGQGLSAGDQLRIRDRIVSACITAYFRGE